MALYQFTVDAMVRGYHEYKEIWEAEDGEVLRCQREAGNRHDLYAVATVKNDAVVGHVPRKISSLYSISFDVGIDNLHCYQEMQVFS